MSMNTNPCPSPEVSELLEWLASPSNPPVRYLCARDLSSGDEVVGLDDLRAEAIAWEPLQKVLALQEEDGRFPYNQKTPTAATTFTALGLMQRCGMTGEDEPFARSLAYLEDHHLFYGSFSHIRGASGVLPCYVGMLTQTLISALGPEHPVVESSIRWILDYQRFDHKQIRSAETKKWPYKAVDSYGGCWWSVSCYHGVVATLRALAALPPQHRSSEVKSRLSEALRYLEIHRVYKKTSGKQLFRHLTQFFLFGGYRLHLIDVLEGIADANPDLVREDWVLEAVQAVDQLAEDGKIPLVKNYNTKLVDPLPFEPRGAPSRFLTYQWLLVKKKFGLW